MAKEKSDVILCVADTLSAFNMGVYGYQKNTTPFLDGLAEDNFVAKIGYSTAPWTVPAHASLFTGKLPDEHGTTSQDIFFSEESLAERMNDRGYRTLGITNNALISPELGFDRGFDKFLFGEDIPIEGRGLDTLGEMLEGERSGRFDSRVEKYSKFLLESFKSMDVSSLVAGISYLKSKISEQEVNLNPDSGALYTNRLVERNLDSSEDNFVFLNYMEPHEPYNPPEKFAAQFVEEVDRVQKTYLRQVHGTKSFDRNLDKEMVDGIRGLYDAEVKYLDSMLEELWNIIEEMSDDFVLVIVGDHGENLGHYGGMWGHQFGIWERLVRVPVIIAGPDIPDVNLEENISIRELHDFIAGEKKLEELGERKVFAEYYGADGFFRNFTEDDPEKMKEDYGEMVFNRSKMLLEEDNGLISNTEAEDFSFVAKEKTFSEKSEEHEMIPDLSSRLEHKFSLLGDIDL